MRAKEREGGVAAACEPGRANAPDHDGEATGVQAGVRAGLKRPGGREATLPIAPPLGGLHRRVVGARGLPVIS